jgi:hypothetical protein
MQSLRDCVLLYNPISNEGHLDSWHVLFIEVFLKAGWGVIPVTHDPRAIQQKLEQKGLFSHPQLLWPEKTWQQASSLLSTTSSFARRISRRVNRVFQSAAQREQDLLANKFLDPQTFKDTITKVLSAYPGRTQLIFNMYVDGYLPHSKVWADMVFSELNDSAATTSIPWAGLCITPEQISEQQASQTLPKYYLLSGYQGTCFLDEALLQSYRTHYPTKHFEFLPDTTETDLPTMPNPLALDIKRLAAGRKIVFMGGSIGKQKNLARWVDMVVNLDPTQWYFVQIGRINVNNLTPADEQALALLKQLQPPNLYIHSDYLPDETVFNAIIAASDVIFAVYRDFYRSSNMLSKAAYFEKPILVADNCLMGKRVTKYEIGLAVPADHSACIQAGLVSLLKLEGLDTKFANYRADFNGSEFSRRLDTFAKNCLPKDQVVN